MINKTTSDLFWNSTKIKPVYEKALKDSGHFSSMSLNNSNTQNAGRNKIRKAT